MKRVTRMMTALSVAVGTAVGGAAVAQAALSWGMLSVSSNGAVQGQGYGDAWAGDLYHAKLASTLRDVRRGNGRTYAQLTGYGKTPQFVLQSGRRADGGDTWAAMGTKTHTNSTALDGYRAAVKVCQDVPLAHDPCSSTAYGWL